MERIRVITDSTANLPKELIKKYNIIQVPFYFEIENKVYRDSIDITNEEIFKIFESKKFLEFKAYPPKVEDFLDTYNKIEEEKIICITISSTISGCYKNALIAKDLVLNKQIEVIDSLNAGSGEGILTYKVIELIENNIPFNEIILNIKDLVNKIKTYVYIDSLKDVYRTGRIPKILSDFGALLSLKPIVSIDFGKIKKVTLSKDRFDGILKLIEIIKREIKENLIFCMHINFKDEEIEFFKNEINKVFKEKKIYTVPFTPIMGYAVLTGAFGVSFIGGEKENEGH
ncbi:MAG: DegV family protein [Caldisericia bacterium]|jgi:DegV family protein with EDD domain|nr:DegV family protein [Caldisericia bacterium]